MSELIKDATASSSLDCPVAAGGGLALSLPAGARVLLAGFGDDERLMPPPLPWRVSSPVLSGQGGD